MAVEDRQADIQVASIVWCQRRPATQGDAQDRKDDERGDEGKSDPSFVVGNADRRTRRRAIRAQARHAITSLTDRHVKARLPAASTRQAITRTTSTAIPLTPRAWVRARKTTSSA